MKEMQQLIPLFWIVGLTLSPYLASAQQSYEDTCSVRYDLNRLFASLDKSKVSSGFLLDYSVNFIDLDEYDGGVIDGNNYVSYETFEYIYRAVRSASVTQNSMPGFINVMNSMNNDCTDETNPVALAFYRYNYIRADALTGGFISYVNGEVSDVYNEGQWLNPYADTCVVAFSPFVNAWEGLNCRFAFDSDYLFSNEAFSSIEFDSGDGTGYHLISFPTTSIIASYTCPGEYELKMKIVTASGSVLYAHSPMLIKLPEQHHIIRGFTRRPAPPVPDTLFIASGYSDTASAYVTIQSLGPDSSHLTAPLIVAEGFDILNPETTNSGANDINDITGAVSLVNAYDIVYVDWMNHNADIRLNAELLKSIIRWVESRKVGENQTIVLGQSMGGLIARYALCSMENSGEDHHISALITHDTPHLGANVPIGLQKAFSYLLQQVDLPSLPPLLRLIGIYDDMDEYIDILEKLINSKSVPQMLIQANTSLFLNAANRFEWQNMLDQIGYPQGAGDRSLINLSISNGGNGNHPTPNEIFSFNASAYIGVALKLVLLLYSVPSGQLNKILNKPGTTNLNMSIHAFKSVSPSLPYYQMTLSYTKKFLWFITYEKVTSNTELYEPNSLYNYDAYKGSYYQNTSLNIDKDVLQDTLLVSNITAHIFAEPSFMFVPNYSSLDAGKTNASVDFWNPSVEKLDMTPFDGYYMATAPTFHTSLTPAMCDWLVQQVNEQIVCQGDPVSGAQLSLSEGSSSVSWISMNPSRASISSSGVLMRHGYSPFSIMAKGMLNGYAFRRVKHFDGLMPGYVLTQSYNVNTEKVTVVASLENTDEIHMLTGHVVHYYWGRSVYQNGIINWSESDSTLSYRFFLGSGNRTTVYFKVQIDNLEWVYSIRCDGFPFVIEPPISLVGVTPEGYLVAEDLDGENVIVEVKGDIAPNKRYLEYSFGEIGSFSADHIYSSLEICNELMDNDLFVETVKQMHPWGNKDFLIMPFSVYDKETGETAESMIQFVYNNYL